MNFPAIIGIVIRGVNHGCLICITFLALEYASFANVNVGVIASLFTSGVIFTAILFYFAYGENLTCRDFTGMAIIIAGVFMIGFGKPVEVNSELELQPELDLITQSKYLLLSVFFAVLCGVSFAINSLVMKHYVQAHKFGPI